MPLKYDTPDVRARFWEKVAKAGPDDCWEWTACRDKRGRGRFNVAGEKSFAARVAWEIEHGERLGARFACHHCDNKGCVNPAHIYAGDHISNTLDAIERKRMRARVAQGETNPMAKLTKEQVGQIRELIAKGVPNTKIGPRFGVSHATVSLIKLGRIWNTAQVSRTDEQAVNECSTP